MTIEILNNYFEQHQRDVLILEVLADTPVVARQLLWFRQRGVDMIPLKAKSAQGYCVDLDPASPIVWDYTFTFEDSDGVSRDPAAYQMTRFPYAEWLKSQELKQHLSEITDLLRQVNNEIAHALKHPKFPRRHYIKRKLTKKSRPKRRLTRKRPFAILRT